MNERQMKAARANMINWLAHPAELAKKPAKIACAGTLVSDGKTYYIFKYKRSWFAQYMLGVCGGYEGDSLENDGCVWSEMEPFCAETAENDARTLIAAIQEYSQTNPTADEEIRLVPLLQLVLLKEPTFDKTALKKELKKNWGVDVVDETPDGVIASWRGAMIFVRLKLEPAPGEADLAAGNNFLWPDGAKKVAEHRAHLFVTCLRGEASALDASAGLVKVVAACCKICGAIGVYANETVYEADMYYRAAKNAGVDGFPCWNLIWPGVYLNDANEINGYTCGLRDFGFDEIEAFNWRDEPTKLADFLCEVANYVVTQNVRLTDGSKVGSIGQKRPYVASKGPGFALEGETIKFRF